MSTSIVLPSEISSSIAKTAVNARSRFYMNAFLYSKLRYRSLQGSEVEEAKGHQMVMLKDESDLDSDMNICIVSRRLAEFLITNPHTLVLV